MKVTTVKETSLDEKEDATYFKVAVLFSSLMFLLFDLLLSDTSHISRVPSLWAVTHYRAVTYSQPGQRTRTHSLTHMNGKHRHSQPHLLSRWCSQPSSYLRQRSKPHSCERRSHVVAAPLTWNEAARMPMHPHTKLSPLPPPAPVHQSGQVGEC